MSLRVVITYAASSGYFCKWLGNLDCGESNFEMVCEGKGLIDCTDGCPGGSFFSFANFVYKHILIYLLYRDSL